MNKLIANSLLALLFIALLMVVSCVELDGQRISWFYDEAKDELLIFCLLYTSPSPRDATLSRMPSSA